MRHQRLDKKFSRPSNERKNLLRGLITSLIQDGKIVTSVPKAKYLKRNIDKMITYATRKDGLTKNRLMEHLPNKLAVGKMIDDILPKLGNRKSGFTRTVRMGIRKGDQTELVRIEWCIDDKVVKNSDNKTAEKIVEEKTGTTKGTTKEKDDK